MADAKKCDICGAYYTGFNPHEKGEYDLVVKNDYGLVKQDLCLECRSKLNNFVQSMKEKKDNA